jgi:hypothetical protein
MRLACVYTSANGGCDTLVAVTARLPEDGLVEELAAITGEAAGPAARAIGDA